MNKRVSNMFPFVYFARRDLLLNPALASELMSKMVAPAQIEPARPGGMIDVSIAFGIIPSLQMWILDVKQGMTIRAPVKDDRQIIFFPGPGDLAVETRQGLFVSDRAFGVNVEADGTFRAQYGAGRRSAGAAVDRPALLQRLATLLDAPVRRRLEFATRFETAVAYQGAVGEMIAALTSPALGAALIASPATAAKMSATVLDLVLQSLPHNFSEDLLKPPKRIAPRHVKRAMDYIDSNAHQPLTIDDLAEICEVSIRSLQYGFRQFLDISPADYMRSVRLEGTRRAIIDDDHTPLAEIALYWEFTNLTRFAARFKAAYGETPAEFRRRRPTPPRGPR